MGILITVRFAKYLGMIKSREDEMDATCSTHGRDEKYRQNFGREAYREDTTPMS
jgi:hypothetical protein